MWCMRSIATIYMKILLSTILVTLQTSYASLGLCNVKISQKEEKIHIKVSNPNAVWGDIEADNVVVQFNWRIDESVEEKTIKIILPYTIQSLSMYKSTLIIGGKTLTEEMAKRYLKAKKPPNK